MKLLSLLFVATLLCSPVIASDGITIDFLFNIKQEKVSAYIADTSLETPLIVWMSFNGDSILNKDVVRRLYFITPERIDLVYTDFRRSETFDQPELNRKRLETLKKTLPQFFKNELTEWRFFGQSAAENAMDAMEMFHGFVVYPRKPAAPASTEVSYIRKLIDSAVVYASARDSNCVVMRTRSKTQYIPTGMFLSKRQFHRHKGKPSPVQTKKYYIPQKKRTQTFITRHDTVKCLKSSYIDPRLFDMAGNDPTVFTVFERNPGWTNKLVVADITGSMAPYTSQLAIWFKLREHLADVEQFVFFNDGDNKADHKKIIGSTGGIYSCPGKDGFDMMYETMRKAMMKGNGGDGPENDIEALIAGIKNCEQCGEVILIADNWAPVKDISLLKSINKPVRIVLCGAGSGLFNSDYLEIARATKGSVHTMEGDITDLMDINEGENVVIGKREYVIRNGKFEIVRAM